MPESILSDEFTAFPDENGDEEVKYANSWKRGTHPISESVVG